MFKPCIYKNNKMCGFAATYRDNLHCGIINTAFEGTKVKNLPKCPKNMSAYEKKKYVVQF
tara:strand:- start:1090 stop:1269 length:180 start_codon:yes stop_codon:yes gene_type:complete